MAPIISVDRLDIGACALCGRPALARDGGVKLADGNPLCAACVREIRFMYPVYPVVSSEETFGYASGLEQMTVDEVRSATESAHDRLEDLRAEFGGYHAVFRIDEVAGESGSFLGRRLYRLVGYVIYGRFAEGDGVKLRMNDRETSAIVEGLTSVGTGGKAGEAGFRTEMRTLCKKDAAPAPGGYLVK